MGSRRTIIILVRLPLLVKERGAMLMGPGRLEPDCRRVPHLHGRRGEDRKHLAGALDAHRVLLRGDEPRGALPRRTSSSTLFLVCGSLLTVPSKPSVGAICVDMSRMDNILKIHGKLPLLSSPANAQLSTGTTKLEQRQTRTSYANQARGGWTSTIRSKRRGSRCSFPCVPCPLCRLPSDSLT